MMEIDSAASALSQLVGMTDSMYLEFGEISWYNIKIIKL
jgi:hypothetical protein